MTLTESLLRVVRSELNTNGITNYLGNGPDNAVYPCVIVNIIGSKLFNYDLNKHKFESITVQFGIYGKDSNALDLLSTASRIEDIFENIIFTYNGNAIEFDTNNFNSSIGPRFNGQKKYWEQIVQYEFIVSKNYEECSSSSSSSSSSESSESSD